MKTLRYLLIALVLVLASVTAQAQFTLNDKVDYQFQSTSTMAGSGTSLPQSAVTGTTTAGDSPYALAPSRPRRALDEGDDEGTEKPGQPNPVGDGMWVLLLLAAGFAAYKTRMRRKATA